MRGYDCKDQVSTIAHRRTVWLEHRGGHIRLAFAAAGGFAKRTQIQAPDSPC
jgi:hypothetical protein